MLCGLVEEAAKDFGTFDAEAQILRTGVLYNHHLDQPKNVGDGEGILHLVILSHTLNAKYLCRTTPRPIA